MGIVEIFPEARLDAVLHHGAGAPSLHVRNEQFDGIGADINDGATNRVHLLDNKIENADGKSKAKNVTF